MHYLNRPLPSLPTEPKPPSQLIHEVQDLSFHNNLPSIFPPEEQERVLNGPFVMEMSERNPWSELPYYNCRIPNFGRSESIGSSSVDYGQVPIFENEDAFSSTIDPIQPNSSIPDQAYSNAEIELNFKNWDTSDADDEQIVQFENADVLGEHSDAAADVTRHWSRKHINISTGTQDLYENRQEDAVSNSNNVLGSESMKVAPTYLNAQAELSLPSTAIDPDYSLDEGQVVKFENEDVVDQLEGNCLKGDGSKTKELYDVKKSVRGCYENVNKNHVSNCHKTNTNRTESKPDIKRSAKLDLNKNMAETSFELKHTGQSEVFSASNPSQLDAPSVETSESRGKSPPVLKSKDTGQAQLTRTATYTRNCFELTL